MQEPDVELDLFLAQVSSRMRMLRLSSGLTQEEVAKACGTSLRSYSDFERGRRSIPIEVFAKFCRNLKVPSDKVLFGNGAPSSPSLSPEIVEEISAGLLMSFGSSSPDEVNKRVKLARYAWESSRAKGKSFSEELKELNSLTG